MSVEPTYNFPDCKSKTYTKYRASESSFMAA